MINKRNRGLDEVGRGGEGGGGQGQMACFPGNFESSEGWTGDQKGWSGNLDR